MDKKPYIVLVPIILCLAVGFLGSVFTAPAIQTWYVTLNKPFFSPPNFLFAPVWTTLYVLMGIAVYLVWVKGIKKNAVKTALSIFAVQLILNFFWSFIFFGLRSPAIALLEIVLLWAFIALTILKFYPLSRTAAILLIPYLLWVTFASLLNLFIVLLN